MSASGKRGRPARPRPWTKLGIASAVRVGVAGACAHWAITAYAANSESSWNGAVDVWSNSVSWDSGIVPQTATNNATVSIGQVTLDASYSIGALNLSGGGVINGTNNLTINGLLTWSGGALADAGVTHATAGINLSGSDSKIIVARTLVNDATASWTGGDFITSSGAIFSNGGTFTTSFDGNLLSQSGPTFFNNSGMLQKTAGTGGTNATTIGAMLNNTGAVQVQAGVLALAGGGSASGSFVVSSGAVLAFQNDYSLAAGSSLSGAGDVNIDLGNVTVAGTYAVTGTTRVNGGSIGFNAGDSTTKDLVLAGGVLSGTGTLTASGAVTWTGSVLQGSGTLVAAGTLDLSGTDHGISAHTLTNAGTGVWSAGNIIFSSGAILKNTGTFENNFAGTMQTTGASPGTFVNAGIFNKTGAGETLINPVLTNSGTINVNVGTLTVAGGGSATGRFELASGTRLRVLSDYNFAAGSTIVGPGTVELSGGSNAVAGTYNIAGNTEVFGGSTSFSGNVTSIGQTLSLFGGFIAFNSASNVDAGKLDQFGGGIDGSGTITFHNLTTWDSGPQKGSGSTIAAGGLLIQGASGKSIEGRTIINAAGQNATWSAGDLLGFDGGKLQNDGTFTNSFDGTYQIANGTPSFVNNGLFIKSGGTGVTQFMAALMNSGTVRVDSGSLVVANGTASGNFNLAAGGIEFAGAYNLGNGASITGTNKAVLSGILNITGAASAKTIEQSSPAEMTGPGNLTIENFTWLGGRLTGTGTTTVTSTLTLAGGGREIDGRTLRIASGAAATWSAGDIGGFPGALIDNAGTFTTTFDGSFLYASTQSAAMNNSGTFIKSGGTSRTTFNVFYNNSGTTRVAAGLIALSGGGSSTGNFDLLGGSVELTGGYVLAQGTTFTGTNPAHLIGDVTVSGNVSGKSADQTAGVMSGTGTLTVENFDWQGGTQGGSGTTIVTSTLGLSTAAQKTIDARTVRDAAGAVATWSAGDLRIGNAGAFENLGTLNASSDNSIFPGDGAAGSFKNSGLFVKNGTSGFTSVFVPFINSGTARVSSGVLSLAAGGNSTGQFDLLGGSMELGGGYVLASGATVTGTNVARIVGDVTVSGAVSAKNVQQTAGTVSGAGTLTIDNFSWKGGAQSGAGATTAITTSLDMSGSGYTLDGRAISNGAASTATWSSGTLFAANGGQINNAGLIDDSFDATIIYQTGTFPVLANSGEFRKSAGTGTTNIGIIFNNTGTARVNSGTLRLAAGGSASGNFDIASGAVLELAFDYTLAAGTKITGTGLTRLTGGVTTINGATTAGAFEQSGGTLTGSGTLATSSFNWKGGILAGTGTTSVSGTLTINGSDLSLNNRTILANGGSTTTWSSGDIRVAQGGTINNLGNFNIAGDVNALRIDGVNSMFNNAGTLRKNAGTGTASFAGIVLNNTGTLEVSSGTLIVGVNQFNTSTGTLAGGTWRVLSGGKLDLGGGPGITTNQANVTLDGATASFPKINDLTLNRGAFSIKNGKQFVAGADVTNAGTINVDATSGMLFGNVFTNTGTYTSAGTTSANFLFNSGTLTQTGPLSVAVQMINSGTGVADIGGAQNWAAGAHLIVSGGSVIHRTDAGTNLTIDANGGTTQFKVSQHLAGLNVNGGVVKIDAGGDKVIRTAGYAPGAGLDSWNGQLDLANNRLIVDYTLGSSIDVIQNQLKSGYNAAGTHWTGNGLISSTAQSDASAGLGYAEASQLPALKANFGGETITGNAVLVRYTKFGDTNLDGRVTFGDFQRLEANFGNPGYWYSGDFNYDGIVDRTDLSMLVQNYGQSIGLPSAPVNAEELASVQAFANSVPEPGGMGVVALAGAMLMRRRKSAKR